MVIPVPSVRVVHHVNNKDNAEQKDEIKPSDKNFSPESVPYTGNRAGTGSVFLFHSGHPFCVLSAYLPDHIIHAGSEWIILSFR